MSIENIEYSVKVYRGLWPQNCQIILKSYLNLFRIPRSEVSDYYEGTGYRMAFVKEPDKIKKRLFRFHINSQDTNALLFYIENEV